MIGVNFIFKEISYNYSNDNDFKHEKKLEDIF